jgi:hypothetical protein
MALSKMTFSIMTRSKMTLCPITLVLTTLSSHIKLDGTVLNRIQHNDMK